MADLSFISTAGENPFSNLKPEVQERGNSGPACEGKKERSQNANLLFFKRDFSCHIDGQASVIGYQKDKDQMNQMDPKKQKM